MTTQKQQNVPGTDFSVVIAASGPGGGGSLVHAVTIIQQMQTWTVIRNQDDFRALAETLSSTISDVPPYPEVGIVNSEDVNTLVSARNQQQQWLNSILMHPSARESPAIGKFLTADANFIPPHYENVPWTMFTANGQVAAPAPPPTAAAPYSPQATAATAYGNGNLDDMVMEDMFDNGDDAFDADNPDDTDDEEEYRPSIRYKPTDEPITEEDEMDIAQIADELQMISDVGSLAQSLGASHLGRSLMLQEELGNKNNKLQGLPTVPQTGLRLGGSGGSGSTSSSGDGGGGGIGVAMQNAPPGLGGSFTQTIPESPPRLDAFKMIKVIGKGSFGKVFLVREIKTGQMFALKVLRKDNIVKRNQVEHTKTERSVLGYVKHPFIVGMNMAFQSKHKLYFVLDYCAGGELFFHLGKLGKFPESRACFYAAEIILAISYVHTLDIIYRDLKPENVLLDAMGHIRLTDFGLSKEGISSSSSGANSFCGTPEYLAPEILNRQGHGRAVDWWSLGALLYEMLTGLPPFYCQDRERLFEKIRKAELNYPASLSPNAKSLLRGLLTKNPDKRLGSGPNDAEDIKKHPFFALINWDKLMRGEVKPPWTPQIAGSHDTSQFDKEFTSMPIFSPHSMQRGHLGHLGATPAGDNPFEGFTFQDKVFMGPAAT